MGTEISCMTDHLKPTVQKINLDHVVVHAGINELRTENPASQIANATINLATYGNTATVSGFVPRLDKSNNKANK